MAVEQVSSLNLNATIEEKNCYEVYRIMILQTMLQVIRDINLVLLH